MYNKAKIRNIRFVRDDDAGYLAYTEQAVLRSMHVPRLVGAMSKSDQLSRTMERVVRDWIKRLRKRFVEQGTPPEKWPSVLQKAYATPDETVAPEFAYRSGGESMGTKLREALREKDGMA